MGKRASQYLKGKSVDLGVDWPSVMREEVKCYTYIKGVQTGSFGFWLEKWNDCHTVRWRTLKVTRYLGRRGDDKFGFDLV